MNTPWGASQSVEEIAEGITFVSTAGHGGIYLSPERNSKVPKKYREYAADWSKGWGDRWYEEDVAALAVVATFPEYFPTFPEGKAKEQLEYWLAPYLQA